jgi:hypothetical protein
MADNLGDRLARALTPADVVNNPDGPHTLNVDTRGLFTFTQWPLAFGASGATTVIGNPGAGKKVYLSAIVFSAQGSLTFQINSPSGTALTGSLTLNPAQPFEHSGSMPNGIVFQSASASPIVINGTGSGNVGGWANGWTA